MGLESGYGLKKLEESQQEFEALPTRKKKAEIRNAQIESQEIDRMIGLYKSPETLIPGMNVENIKTGADRIEESYKRHSDDSVHIAPSEYGPRAEDGSDNPLPFSNFAVGELYYDAKKSKESKGEMIKKLRELYNGIPVVDLGAGKNCDGYRMASYVGAAGYVGIEPNNWKGLTEAIIQGHGEEGDKNIMKRFPKLYEDCKDPYYSVVAEDALTFLKRLPDHSVGLFSFGTDNNIIQDGNYIRSVNQELKRVLHPQSALITVNSVFNGDSEGAELEYLKKPTHRDNFNVWRQKGPKTKETSVAGAPESTQKLRESFTQIDTKKRPKIPEWINILQLKDKRKSILEHDTSLGTITWDKEKYKDAFYLAPGQTEGLTREEIVEHFRQEKILNATVFDYLLDNKDEIPHEWKGKKIYFWGTVFGIPNGRQGVRYLEFEDDEWKGKDNIFLTKGTLRDDSPAIRFVP